MLKTFYGTALFIAFLMRPFFSQAQMQEIGLRVSTNLTNLSPSFIYKKQIGENLYKRYNGAFANLNLNQGTTGSNYSLGTSLSFGKEKRRDIGKRLKFINGLQYLGGIGFSYANDSSPSNANTQTMFNGSFGLGYLLGIHFELSPSFYVNLETIPSANISYQSSSIKRQGVTTNSNGIWGDRKSVV